MAEHWQKRRQKALENGRNAASPNAREAYFRVAEHYRALEQWCSGVRPAELRQRAG